MNVRRFILLLLVWVAGVAAGFAQRPEIGTWKLNESKSVISPGASKMQLIVVEPDGDNMKVTSDGVQRDGKPFHNEWTGKFDGRDYPVTGADAGYTRAYTVVDDHTVVSTTKLDGKAITTARGVVSPDGKTRTVNVTGTDPDGRKIAVTAVFDKQ